MIGKTIQELKVGDKVSNKTIITEKNVEMFGEIIGDFNPAHFDEEYASKTIFKKRIAHGMLIGSLFSKLLGTYLPGPGSIYISQSLRFRRPVYFGDEINAVIKITEINVEKNRVKLECIAYNQSNDKVVIGEAEIMPPIKEEM
ncbi:MAG: MaoC family dehydratase [Candidatus Izimaplasma sp.]|nr:MaoC family dehydratase [Candidatus Izimaplasma bacterium]